MTLLSCLILITAFIWLEYCHYCVKHKTINQSKVQKLHGMINLALISIGINVFFQWIPQSLFTLNF